MPGIAQYFPSKIPLKEDEGINLNIFQCSGCGLVQLNNTPVSYYKEAIRAAEVSKEMKEFRTKQFKTFIEECNLDNQRILEIGCGRGEYLKIMERLNNSSYGLEFSKEAIDYCIKQNLKVTEGYIEKEDHKIKYGPFKAFFILNFLEHLPNINTVLRGIYNNLTEDGVGLVEVPNFDMILEKKLFSEFMNDHLFYFTESTLRKVLSINGFEVINCSSVWYDYMISATVRKIQKMQIDEFHVHQNYIKAEIETYINKFNKGKIAIWGAGHQALAVISLINLSDRIDYVIDSASFKQDKYTPSTYLPIYSPEKLIEEPVDAVIVMAASFSDEVANNLIKNFEGTFSISILREDKLEIIR